MIDIENPTKLGELKTPAPLSMASFQALDAATLGHGIHLIGA